MNISEMTLSSLTGEIPCSCGKTHTLITKRAEVVKDAPRELAAHLSANGVDGRILLLCDANTWEVLGASAFTTLSAIAPVDVCTLRGNDLHADEEAIGSALLAMSPETARIVAVGSGTVNDIARYIASRTRLPYDILGTAPSMDGFVSSVSPLIRRGFKFTFEAVAPTYAFLDLDAMCGAPQAMIAAGLGDVMGKYTALADWTMARDVYQEDYCEEIAALMRRAVDTCAACAGDLTSRSPEAIKALGEGLLLAGMAMQLVGDSRPASGAEHHVAHFWEIMQLARGEKPTLHGDKVGYAALLILDYYRVFYETMRPFRDVDPKKWLQGVRDAYGIVADEVLASTPPDGVPNALIRQRTVEQWDTLRATAEEIIPLRDDIAAMLRSCGGPSTAAELQLSRDDVRTALLYAKEIRTRPTIMRLAFAMGVHEEICDAVLMQLFRREESIT